MPRRRLPDVLADDLERSHALADRASFGVAELYMLGGRHKAFKSGAAGCAGTSPQLAVQMNTTVEGSLAVAGSLSVGSLTVAGDAGSLQATLLYRHACTAWPTANCGTLSQSNSLIDVPNFSTTFTLTTTRLIFATFHFSYVSDSYLVAEFMVDDVPQAGSTSVTGTQVSTSSYGTTSAQWFGSLDAGTHVIKVRYHAGLAVAFDQAYKGYAMHVVAL